MSPEGYMKLFEDGKWTVCQTGAFSAPNGEFGVRVTIFKDKAEFNEMFIKTWERDVTTGEWDIGSMTVFFKKAGALPPPKLAKRVYNFFANEVCNVAEVLANLGYFAEPGIIGEEDDDDSEVVDVQPEV